MLNQTVTHFASTTADLLGALPAPPSDSIGPFRLYGLFARPVIWLSDAMANWIMHGDPGLDLWPFDVRRFGAPHAQAQYLQERAIEAREAKRLLESEKQAATEKLKTAEERLKKLGEDYEQALQRLWDGLAGSPAS